MPFHWWQLTLRSLVAFYGFDEFQCTEWRMYDFEKIAGDSDVVRRGMVTTFESTSRRPVQERHSTTAFYPCIDLFEIEIERFESQFRDRLPQNPPTGI